MQCLDPLVAACQGSQQLLILMLAADAYFGQQTEAVSQVAAQQHILVLPEAAEGHSRHALVLTGAAGGHSEHALALHGAPEAGSEQSLHLVYSGGTTVAAVGGVAAAVLLVLTLAVMIGKKMLRMLVRGSEEGLVQLAEQVHWQRQACCSAASAWASHPSATSVAAATTRGSIVRQHAGAAKSIHQHAIAPKDVMHVQPNHETCHTLMPEIYAAMSTIL